MKNVNNDGFKIFKCFLKDMKNEEKSMKYFSFVNSNSRPNSLTQDFKLKVKT